MSLPRLSIVVPSYNQSGFLAETLGSILDQQYPHLQIIIVDGASTDQTPAVLRAYEPRINTIISEPDNGQTEAINKGLRLATGEFVTWVCSDDTLLPASLQVVAETIASRPDINWLGGLSQQIDAEGQPLKLEPRSHGITLRSTLLRSPGNPFSFPQPGVWWRTDLHDHLGYLDETLHYCMDFEWWLRLLSDGQQPHVIDQPIATYRMHEASKTCAQPDGFIREHVRVERAYANGLSLRDRWLVYRRTAYQQRSARLESLGRRPWPEVITRPWWLLSQQVRHHLWHGQPQAA